MKNKISVIMCIDIEPDMRLTDRNARLPWKGYERAYEFFRELRPRLIAATGSTTHFLWSFRMDPQVAETYGSPAWAVTHYPQYVEHFQESGDELGSHTHAWAWDRVRRNWIADFANQEWVDHCVHMSLETYKKILKKDCDSFRFGDRWMSNASIGLLEELGVRFDLTLEPGQPSLELKELFTGSVPDHSSVPKIPYRVSKADFKQPDPKRREGLWMVPLSTGRIQYQLGRSERAYRRLFYPETLKPIPMTLNVAEMQQSFSSIVDELLSGLERPYLALVMTTASLVKPGRMEKLRKNFNSLLTHPFAKQFVFSTPAEAMITLGFLESPAEKILCAES